MKKLYLDSETVSPTGNIASQGIINQLGRPSLDLLAILIREAVQNSWDARISDKEPVRFSIDGYRLSNKQHKFLRDIVFSNCPPITSLSLEENLNSGRPITVLSISDRGTIGLGGPTRADIPTGEGEPRDFVDFLRNIGQPPEKTLSGGTYGYGKAAYYRASEVRTIYVYTRCMSKGNVESRFIASALGNSYQSDSVRYTGRHWWGRKDASFAEPLLNNDADAVANSLGIPGFLDNERGTVITILQPILNNNGSYIHDTRIDDEEAYKALEQAAQDIILYFWPKMLTYDNGTPSMQFNITWQGNRIILPDPTAYPPIQPFVRAMYRLKGHFVDTDSPFRHAVYDIECPRPAKILGKISFQSFPVNEPGIASAGNEDQDSPFLKLTHHTALMRTPEFVVKYVEGPSTGTEMLGYAGVFISDESADPIFASSEPPTHDNWAPDSLEDRSWKKFVRTTLREISNLMDSYAKPPAVHAKSEELTPLGAFSARLGSSLLPSEQGPAATSDLVITHSQNRNTRKDNELPRAAEITVNSTGRLEEGTEDQNSQDTESRIVLILPPPEYQPSSAPSGGDIGENEHIHQEQTTPIIGKARVHPVSEGIFVLIDGMPAVKVEFSIKHGENSSGTLVQVIPRAIIDGAQIEIEPPIGGSTAKVLRWMDATGNHYHGSSEVFIPSQDNENWAVIISLPDDMLLGVDFKAEAKV